MKTMKKIKNDARKITTFGKKTPRKTERSKLISTAVEKAVHDYKEAYKRLAWE